MENLSSISNSSVNSLDNDPGLTFWISLSTLAVAYLPALIVVVGVLANVLSAVVLARLRGRLRLSVALYLFISVLTDVPVLLMCTGIDWLSQYTNIKVKRLTMNSSSSVCMLYPFIADVSVHLGTWCLIAMATETACCRLYPRRSADWCQPDRAKSVVLLLLVLAICVNAHCFWTYELINLDNTRSDVVKLVCTNLHQGNQQNNTFVKLIWPIVDAIVTDVLPFIIAVTCCVVFLKTSGGRRRRPRDQAKNNQLLEQQHLKQLQNKNQQTQFDEIITIKDNLQTEKHQLRQQPTILDEQEKMWRSNGMDAVAAAQLQRTVIILCVLYVTLFFPKLIADVHEFTYRSVDRSTSSDVAPLSAATRITDTAKRNQIVPGLGEILDDEEPLEYITMTTNNKDFIGSTSTLAFYVFLGCKPFVLAITSRPFLRDLLRLVTCGVCKCGDGCSGSVQRRGVLERGDRVTDDNALLSIKNNAKKKKMSFGVGGACSTSGATGLEGGEGSASLGDGPQGGGGGGTSTTLFVVSSC